MMVNLALAKYQSLTLGIGCFGAVTPCGVDAGAFSPNVHCCHTRFLPFVVS